MTYATMEDRNAIEAEMTWEDREVPETMHQLLAGTAARFGDRNAITFQMFSDPKAPAETLSWSALLDKSCQAANLFRSLGVGETDVVAFLLPNATETVLTYLGGSVAGIVNPINPLLEPEHIAGILKETNAKVLVTLKAFPKTDVAEKAAAAVAMAPNVQTVLEVDLLRYMTGLKKFIIPLIRPKTDPRHKARVLDFNKELGKQSRTLDFADSAGDRIAAYFHTGGTTGLPKVAQHRYSGIIYNAWLGQRLLFTEHSVQMTPLPLFHVFATIVSLGASLGSGAHVIFPTPQGYRGDGVFDNLWKLIERYKATFLIGVPTALSAMMQRPVNGDISSLKLVFCGSSPLPIELYKRFEKAASATVCEGYGLTEATCLVSINPPDGTKKVGSVGIPFPYSNVRILNFTSDGPAESPINEIGEICVDSPGVFEGKTYTQTEKNNGLFHHDIYLRTGDLGKIDEDGYLWITGRAKDLIIRGGHNIDPAEIEEALAGHDAVAFAAAIGQPDGHAGEIPCAYVELVAGAKVSEEELLTYAKEHIHERAAHPKYLEVMPELPKTAVGKTLKNELRKLAIARIYGEALSNSDVAAEIAQVIEDKSLGLVAELNKTGTVSDDDVVRALGAFTRPWRWAA